MNQATPPPERRDRDERSSGLAVWVFLALFVLFCLVLLPFIPLLLSLAEQLVLGTDHVEHFCRMIGIHDELAALYDALFSLFR